eukprot:4627065-Amphidinium_carterae.2
MPCNTRPKSVAASKLQTVSNGFKQSQGSWLTSKVIVLRRERSLTQTKDTHTTASCTCQVPRAHPAFTSNRWCAQTDFLSNSTINVNTADVATPDQRPITSAIGMPSGSKRTTVEC